MSKPKDIPSLPARPLELSSNAESVSIQGNFEIKLEEKIDRESLSKSQNDFSILSSLLAGPLESLSSVESLHSTQENTIKLKETFDRESASKSQSDISIISSKRSSIQNEKSKSHGILASTRQASLKETCKINATSFALICIFCATITMIIWYSGWSKNNQRVYESYLDQVKEFDLNSACPAWHFVGDEYCDDEVNIEDCGYDSNDCCKLETDRSQCQNCTCFIPENKQEEMKQDFCNVIVNTTEFKYLVNMDLGDERCDLSLNKAEYFFDLGDCCLVDAPCFNRYSTKTIYNTKFNLQTLGIAPTFFLYLLLTTS